MLMILSMLFVFQSCKKGDQGPKGPIGPTGATGPAGNDGSVIYSGNIEPPTTTGNNGDYYLNTANGNFYGPKSTNGWGTSFNLTGPRGATGTTGATGNTGTSGNTILSGTVNPTAANGAIGDFYLNRTTYTLYGPKTAQGWGMGLELKGKDGTQGIKTFVTQNYQSLTGPVFFSLPGVTEQAINNGYVAAFFRREQLRVNPGFYRLYPMPYSFAIEQGGANYIATIYHFIVSGGQVGVTFVTNAPLGYEFAPTLDFSYSFRFTVLESSAVQQLSAENPHVNFKDSLQVNNLLKSY